MSVEVNNLSKFYGKQEALKNISFSIESGEIVGLLGPNGAGKSTLMKILAGYLAAKAGDVSIYGLDVFNNSIEARKLIGYLPEHNPLYLDAYIKEYLYDIAGIYKLKNKKNRVSEIIELTGLGLEQNKKIGALSKGYRQRVGIAQALIHDPKLLILDEPTTGLDPNQLDEVRALIRNLAKDKTILLSTHIMQEVEAICDRTLIINRGQLVADSKFDNNMFNSKFIELKVEIVGLLDIRKLENIMGVEQVVTEKNNVFRVFSSIDLRSELYHFCVSNNLILLEMSVIKKDIEDVFRNLTLGIK